MQKYNDNFYFRIDDEICNIINRLKEMNINISLFIRDSIKDKYRKEIPEKIVDSNKNKQEWELLVSEINKVIE